MAQSIRQRNLFAAEDFTVVYDSFKQANFQAYDFDTIRVAMVDYIRNNYPENFNDWIKSSEFVALIELIAFLGHSLAFRVDLASRENFLSTAERRASILRIADFLGYNPVRSIPANGVLKITSVKTTQNVYNVNGESLKGVEVPIIDSRNPSAYQDFLLVVNEILNPTNKFGKPNVKESIDGIDTEIYKINTTDDGDVVFPFKAQVNGEKRSFEVTSNTIDDDLSLSEETPTPGTGFNIVYRDDKQGIGSANTGFFVGFKQGTLSFKDYDADEAIPSLLLDLESQNINNSDVWVHSVDTSGNILSEWTEVDSTYSTSVIFNAFKNNREMFSIKTIDNDNVAIQFGDGIFSDIPRGILRIWYRESLNETYTLNPDDVGTVKFSLDYIAADGNEYTVTFGATLRESVNTASSRESNASIKDNAGRVFATQDRMISAEDYNVLPFTVGNNVRKIKSINRTHSGHSRFIKDNDPTGQYQNVNIISGDGYMYSEVVLDRSTIALPTQLTNSQIFEKYIDAVAYNPEVINLFYQNYEPIEATSVDPIAGIKWQRVSTNSQSSTGFFQIDTTSEELTVERTGDLAATELQNVKVGSMIEFIESSTSSGKIETIQVVSGGSGYSNNTPLQLNVVITGANGSGTGATAYANVIGGEISSIDVTNTGYGYQAPVSITIDDPNGTPTAAAVITSTPSPVGRTWARVTSVFNDGLGLDDVGGISTGRDSKGKGAIALSKQIPDNAIVSKIFQSYSIQFTEDEKQAIITEISNNNTFGVRYDADTTSWEVITTGNLPGNVSDDFDLTNAGTVANTNNDNSWIVRMRYSSNQWVIYTRKYRIVFGSEEDVRFYNQNDALKFNVETNKAERDSIKVYSVNTDPAGGVYTANGLYSLGEDIMFYTYKYYAETDGYTDDHKVILSISDANNDGYPDNPLAFKTVVGNLQIGLGQTEEDGYSYTVYDNSSVYRKNGRANIQFQWKRVSETTNRIDPSISNIIDIFVLTENYDTVYRDWLINDRDLDNRPLTPSSNELSKQFLSLDRKKSISDTLIYRSAKYKTLFGSTADSNLQAKFRVVKVPGVTLSDSQIQSRIVTAITDFFNVDNWDFGETFYYTELAAYVHNRMVGIISGIVIVPLEETSSFGDLFQVTPDSDEIFIPDLELSLIEIVNNFTGDNLRTVRT